MKTPLKIAKGLGSARNGVDHWWWQRITAIALIPLAIWFAMKLVCVGCVSNPSTFASKFYGYPVSLIIFTAMLLIMIFHSTMGVKVIIEDYVSCNCAKITLIIFIKLFAWLTGIFLFFAAINKYVQIVV